MTTLRNAPYSLDWGDSVYAKVVAINVYGESVESDEGNNGYITTNPDPPTALMEVYE